jgi:hypothetical protein
MQAAFTLAQKNWLWITVESVIVAFLTALSFASNLIRQASPEPSASQTCSSFGLVMQKVAEQPFDLDAVDTTLRTVPAQRFLWSWTAETSGRQSMSAKK